MKKNIIRAAAVLAVVVSAFAFKSSNYFSDGSVFCSNTCASSQQVAFRIDPSGVTDQVTNPCAGKPVTLAHYFDNSNTCVATTSGTTKFVTTTSAGN